MGKTIRIAALATCSLLIAARPVTPSLQGEYQSDCAPNDGPAFIIILPATVQQGEFWLRANAPLARIAGRWSHVQEMGVRPGLAMIQLCRKTPNLVCESPSSGSFRIRGKPGATLTGSFEAQFGKAQRQSYRFTARPARLAEPVICG